MDSTLFEIFKAIAGVTFAVVAVVSAIIVAAFIIRSVRILFDGLLKRGKEQERFHVESVSFCQLPGETMVLVPEHERDCNCLSCQINRRMEDADRRRDEQIDADLEEATDRDNYEPPDPDYNADGPAERDHRMDEARRMK